MNNSRLQELMTERGIGWRALSRAVGIRESTLFSLSQAKSGGSVGTWEKLADYFEVTLDYIRGRSAPEPQPVPQEGGAFSRGGISPVVAFREQELTCKEKRTQGWWLCDDCGNCHPPAYRGCPMTMNPREHAEAKEKATKKSPS